MLPIATAPSCTEMANHRCIDHPQQWGRDVGDNHRSGDSPYLTVRYYVFCQINYPSIYARHVSGTLDSKVDTAWKTMILTNKNSIPYGCEADVD